jgi:hypothetical protein
VSQTVHHRLHILEAADWKAGVITLLNPDSPYRPWRYAFGGSRRGDYAMLVLGTDPVSVLTVLARIGDEDGGGGGMLNLDRYRADVVDLTCLAMLLDIPDAFTSWRLDDDDAERVVHALHESRVYGRPFYKWGHSSVVAARNLLSFDGTCDGCEATIDLCGRDACENVHVHTADPLPRPDPDSPIRTPGTTGRRRPHLASLRSAAEDWPAVLCRECDRRMRDDKFASFVAFKFAQHPECPNCGGARTQAICYGMPADPDSWGPWLDMGGCVLRDEKWHCGCCGHRWG